MADILADMGYLFLGSRLKRLAERLQADAARLLKASGLPIQPAQFPLLAAIDRYGPLTIGDAVEALGVSQPAVTRTASSLLDIGLLAASRDDADMRQKTLALTEAGKALMARAKAVLWPPLDLVVTDLCGDLSGALLDQIGQLETKLDHCSMEMRVNTATLDASQAATGLSIREYSDDLAEDFYRINAEWIEQMFVLEENDRQILSHPRELIIDRGGIILFVEDAELGVVGTCALIRIDEGSFELTKMGVSERARGRKAGEFLLASILERARAMAMGRLYLLTNRKCASAIHLYEKLGFVHDAEIMATYGSRYERCNVAMSYPL
ncbi:bifunctional helix-turn-helix transcriptional regulator/GNAT family N-acetyltransferase [Sphingomonas sp. PR090111-T3T-6A]|uniref:bifunctional helix-turn-helix transcriptional regulator/GNAT family N-acetyltransferase n=1 Tax=Sphingomonas sp. PR090111-T3T-6A TaxID=685778 RepID=UPI00036DEF6A|nr:bifunctional helix-turn-helix transcriptional regulator/GNAT family N-acetyltransferase [Sphingomonas sp. PR090111-T3T-6A]